MDTSVVKALYALYSGEEDDLCIINSRFFEDIEELKRLGIIKNEKNSDMENKLCVNIPVLTEEEHKWLKSKIIYEYHIRGYNFPVAVMYQIVWNGLYLSGRDFQKEPLPVMVMTVGEKK